jgi:hypothetical protein
MFPISLGDMAAEVGQGRLRVNAEQPVTPAHQVIAGSPAVAGDDP